MTQHGAASHLAAKSCIIRKVQGIVLFTTIRRIPVLYSALAHNRLPNAKAGLCCRDECFYAGRETFLHKTKIIDAIFLLLCVQQNAAHIERGTNEEK